MDEVKNLKDVKEVKKEEVKKESDNVIPKKPFGHPDGELDYMYK